MIPSSVVELFAGVGMASNWGTFPGVAPWPTDKVWLVAGLELASPSCCFPAGPGDSETLALRVKSASIRTKVDELGIDTSDVSEEFRLNLMNGQSDGEHEQQLDPFLLSVVVSADGLLELV